MAETQEATQSRETAIAERMWQRDRRSTWKNIINSEIIVCLLAAVVVVVHIISVIRNMFLT